MNQLLKHNLRYNGSYQSLQSMAKDVVNTTPGATIKVPVTMYKIRNSINPIFDYKMQYKCTACGNYSINAKECDSCKFKINQIRSNYFAYIPIEQQLVQTLKSDSGEIISYYRSVLSKDQITDIHNSQCFENIRKKYQSSIILPLIINTDGAKLHKISTNSLWMLQCYQAYLPPHKRYMISNILIAAAHFGEKKPNMDEFFYSFLKDIREIQNKGGINLKYNGEEYNFMPFIVGLCCDIPAKKEVLCTVGHAGRFACNYCLHPGISHKSNGDKKSYIRYLAGNNDYELRSHQSIINTYKRLKTTPINGIMGISPMIAAKEFDLVNGVSIDYMHAALLGITKKLLSLWLDSKNHGNDYYIKKQQQNMLSARLISQKPISELLRKPREVTIKNDFKANEYRSLLLYYLRFALYGVLPKKYINNFILFSNSIYDLSRNEVSLQSIEKANKQLEKFANDFEVLYGKSNVTINIHLIRHLATCVRNLGPLWVHSAFVFESNNGVICKSIKSKKDILHQLSWKYVMNHTVISPRTPNKLSISEKKNIVLSDDEKKLFHESGLEIKNNHFTIYRTVHVEGIKYTSSQSKEKQTVDYFVLVGEQIGCINYYFISDTIIYVMFQNYAIIDKIDHFIKVCRTEVKKIIKFTDIKVKVLFLKFGLNEFITTLPNKYEKT